MSLLGQDIDQQYRVAMRYLLSATFMQTSMHLRLLLNPTISSQLKRIQITLSYAGLVETYALSIWPGADARR
jgi:hypothetical protein